MFAPEIVIAAVINGLLTGAVYALVSVALTLVYGVLHIINFAHGAILTAAMFAAFFAEQAGVDPLIAVFGLAPLFFVLGYGAQRYIIGPASHGEDSNTLLVTLGLSILIENALLAAFGSDTRTIDVPYGFSTVDLGFVFLPAPRVIAFAVTCVTATLLWALLKKTDTGKAIRAVAKEKLGAALVGIDVAHVYAVTFGLGAACLAIAACVLLPSYYVQPRVGDAYVFVAFTVVVLGGMGSAPGAMIGGLFIGVVESLSGLYFGESLGQLGIFVIFILALLVRPTGLFGARA
ncbi:branched-chain amino acid ABC transporter permease [Methylocapsa sp. S129]|uniref:branched-chain amino acid ABC transporter permease n=1 Tax=Methylocapsa sp. S129 TaxID=1641869 RepID=UPI00131CF531|nr:branched-chain amino acid ABC transporter permease [Methylocapsa sp. S129]